MIMLQGGMSSICEGEFDMGCSSYQRLLIDALNIIFLSVYFVALIVSLLTWNDSNGRRRKNSLFFVVSVCCVGVGVVYITFFAWITLSRKDRGIAPSASQVYIARGIIWVFISISLNFHPTKWTRISSAVWWVGFSLLVSALNVRILIEEHILGALEITSWLANLLLLVCGIKLVQEMFGMDRTNEISEPLLTEEKRLEAKKAIKLSDTGFFSKLSFSWLNPLLRSGYRKPLSLNDIPDLESEDSAGLAYSTFSREWELQRKKSHKTKNLSLFSLGQCYKKEMLLVGLYAMLKTIAVVVAPLLIYSFIQYSNREDRKPQEGLVLVGCLMTAKMVESLSQRHWFFNSRRYGMRMRSGMMAAVFRKLLKITTLGRKEHSTGEIVNYIAVDAYRLGEFPWWFHMAWSLPIQMLLSVVILFCVAGSGATLGMIPLVICGLLNIPFAKMLQNSQYQFMVGQDERLRATSQILNNMKVIKLQSWEEHFHKMVESLREVEFKWLREAQMKKSYTTALYWMSPTIVSAVIFAGCAVIGSAPLNSSTIFTVLATMRVLAEPVRMLPEVLSVMIQLKVSLDRLDVFLLEDELKHDYANRINKSHKGEECIRIENGVFSWDLDEGANVTLKNIDLQIMRGHKIAVCGHVGSSKSSLLFAVLGEIPRVSGNVEVYGTIAYVSQTSWIQGGTVQDNILYGKPMDKKRYERAIKVCALDKDIENFDNGDLTEIGQRGLNLSGGQKQRVQLARAVYSDADIYLLDDPFSAVDAHTAAILFNDCVMSALRDKTVILVTHQIEFLPELDKILVMEDGKVNQAGRYEELLKAGTIFDQLVDAHQSTMAIVDPSNHEIQEEIQTVFDTRLGAAKQQSKADISVNTIFAVQLTEEEEKEIGDSGWKAYIAYIRIAKNYFQMFAVVFSQFTFTSLQMLATYWLAVAVEIPNVGAGLLIGAYAVISIISCMFVHLRSVLGAVIGLRASKAFFTGFMDSVFKAPMLFFDSTPVGRILIRASSDMNILDFDISFSIAYVVAAFIDVTGTIIIMTFVTWQILIAAIPVLIAMHYVQKYYLVSARELVRINGTTKAPVMNYATETSFGVTTIRAFNAAEQFITNNLKLIDTDAKLYFHTIGAMEWVLLRVETLQNLTIFTAATLLVLLPNNSIAPGLVGLSLSYALTLTSSQVFFTRWFSSLDNHIISVERIKQFMYLPSEAPAIINNNRPPLSWPHEGRIDLQDLKIKYRQNAPLVLKGITCTLAPGEKIGVVGRTGSGKSTLISALFRLVEATEGRIIIDKLDISSIGLKDLRMKLSIIPQDPTLFRGSVRRNLDPLGLHSDHEIWEALDKCQLKNTITNLPNLLDSSVSDEGENWSVGQRQLFCLGRVLLRRNKILVLDEATASIDAATDATLQGIIRQEFANCTVVTVAHRVPTVMDSDMVMVLSYGNLIEYDKPSNLMGTNSSFSKLVTEYWSNCSRKSFHNLLNV